MSCFLKGNQQLFIFAKEDIKSVLNHLFANNFVIYRSYTEINKSSNDIRMGKESVDRLEQISFDDNYEHYYWIVPKDKRNIVSWEEIKLNSGGVRYRFDNLKSRGVELTFSDQSPTRIGIGRVAICTEWEDDNKEISKATYEKEIYSNIKNTLRRQSQGKIGGIFVGKKAFQMWEANEIDLAYNINNGSMVYNKEHFKPIRK